MRGKLRLESYTQAMTRNAVRNAEKSARAEKLADSANPVRIAKVDQLAEVRARHAFHVFTNCSHESGLLSPIARYKSAALIVSKISGMLFAR
jgi:hypothetical protein